MRLNYAIIYVAEMDRSVAFYRDIFGLRLKFQSPSWSEFDTGAATVALHQSEPGGNSGDGTKSEAGTCRPGMGVEDLEEFHGRMVSNGVICVQEPKSLFGARMAQYRDPDGLVISVSESQTKTTE